MTETKSPTPAGGDDLLKQTDPAPATTTPPADQTKQTPDQDQGDDQAKSKDAAKKAPDPNVSVNSPKAAHMQVVCVHTLVEGAGTARKEHEPGTILKRKREEAEGLIAAGAVREATKVDLARARD